MNDSGEMRRALVADDERAMARFVEVNLARVGYEVTVVFDGRSALEEIDRNTFDLFVLDVTMPYVNGFEVLQSIRNHPQMGAAQVVMLTAEDGGTDVFKGYQLGADVYLTKPVAAQELMRVIGATEAAPTNEEPLSSTIDH